MKDVKSDLRENEGRWHTVGPIWFKHFSPRLSQLIERSDQRKMIGKMQELPCSIHISVRLFCPLLPLSAQSHLFFLFTPYKGLRPTYNGEGNLLYSVCCSKCYLIQRYPPRHTHNTFLSNIWASLGLVKLTHKISHHNSISWTFPISLNIYQRHDFIAL